MLYTQTRHSLRLPIGLPVRRSSIWCGSSLCRTAPRARSSVSTSPNRSISARITVSSTVQCWTLRAAKVLWASNAARQFFDDLGEFALQDGDALCNDFIGFETADCFDVVEEACRGSVVVEGFVGVGRSAVEVYAGFVLGPRYLLETC